MNTYRVLVQARDVHRPPPAWTTIQADSPKEAMDELYRRELDTIEIHRVWK